MVRTIAVVVVVATVWAASPRAVQADGLSASHDNIKAAIARARPVLSRAVENYPKHRDCFSCHHHTLPLLAMGEIRSAALQCDEPVFAGAADFTQKFFAARKEKLRNGTGIGGQAATVSYGLWTLGIAQHQPDDTTAAMVDFLLKTQRDDGRWVPQSNRPPLEESHIATTVLAAYYMPQFCNDTQSDDVSKSVLRARKWLAGAELASHEDRVFHLWGLHLLEDQTDASVGEQQTAARDALLAAQRDDGGWSQLPDMSSDAYATGQTLYVLRQAGVPKTSDCIARGIEFLLRTQHDDGSWLVETRSHPVQVFFDNGDPHGKSQFISIAATSWAVAAIAASQTPKPPPHFSFDLRDDRVLIRAGEADVGTYVLRDEKISRPFFAQLKTLSGAQITRNHPPREGDATDHAEFHPGLWLAFGDFGGADNWRLNARVEHVEFVEKPSDDSMGFAVRNRYLANDGQRVIAEEIARYTFDGDLAGWLLTCDSTFSSNDADFAFGDQEEMSLGVRMHTPLAVASGKGGRIQSAAGDRNEKNVWGKSSPWCDYAGPLDDHFVGVTLMAHPKNFRPPWWHVRDYGLMVANPFGQSALARGERSSIVVKRGEKLRLRFGVLLHDHASEKEFDPAAAYKDYVRLSE